MAKIMDEMFCFQCQQTAHNSGCEGQRGVCGKKSDTANAQDDLIGALITLAFAAEKGTTTKNIDAFIIKGLFTTIKIIFRHIFEVVRILKL